MKRLKRATKRCTVPKPVLVKFDMPAKWPGHLIVVTLRRGSLDGRLSHVGCNLQLLTYSKTGEVYLRTTTRDYKGNVVFELETER